MQILLYIYIITLVVLLLYGIRSLILVVIRFFLPGIIKNPPLGINDPNLPVVTVQCPVYNEKNVIERVIQSVCKLNYPPDKLEIQVLDDSTDNSSEIADRLISEMKLVGFDISHIKRDSRTGFKAGALKNGLEKSHGSFIAVFDADFIPEPDFLLKTLACFGPDTGFVQAGWGHINEKYSILTRTQAIALNSHFTFEQDARARAGSLIGFNGSCGIWRKECIIQSGNWQWDTLAEDFDLSFRAQINGWKGFYYKDSLAMAELPPALSVYKQQQFRWVKGTFEASIKLLGSIFKTVPGLIRKIDSVMQLSGGIVYPLLLIIGILNLPVAQMLSSGDKFKDVREIMPVFLIALLATFLYFLFSKNGGRMVSFKKILLFPFYSAVSIGLSVNNTFAVFQAALGIKTSFVRTPKYNSKSKYKRRRYFRIRLHNIFELALSAYYLYGIIKLTGQGDYLSLPFFILFFTGYFYFGVMSVFRT